MGNKIKFKRGSKSNLPERLAYGEPAFVSDEKELYIGTQSGNIKLTNTKEVNTIKGQLDNIVNKVYEINVCNPPTETGLKPYVFGGDVEENSNRVQAIFDYVISTQYSITNDISINTGYCYKLKFPVGNYKFNKILYPKGLYLIFDSDRALIESTHGDTIFYFQNANGWNTEMEGFTFRGCTNPIKFESSNLEMGNTTFKRCWFIDNKGIAIDINKQSQMLIIEECKFHLNDYDLQYENVDKVLFNKNWVSIKGRSKSKDANFICKGSKFIGHDNLFVPRTDNSGITETAYFNLVKGSIKLIDNHFGGEPGARTIVNVLETCKMNLTLSGNPKGSLVEIRNSESLYATIDYCAVRLFTLPINLIVSGNFGFVDNTVIAKWGNGVDEATEITHAKQYCQIDIQMNNGYRVMNPGSLHLIPKNLKKFLYNPTKYTNEIDWNGDLAVYENYAIFDTKIKKNSVGEEIHTYFMQVSFMPTSGMYRSVTFGIINFITLYKDSKVVTQVHFTPVFDKTGGMVHNESNNIKVVFQENETDTIVTNGAANPNNSLILKITTERSVAGKFKVKIREFEDGATLRL